MHCATTNHLQTINAKGQDQILPKINRCYSLFQCLPWCCSSSCWNSKFILDCSQQVAHHSNWLKVDELTRPRTPPRCTAACRTTSHDPVHKIHHHQTLNHSKASAIIVQATQLTDDDVSGKFHLLQANRSRMHGVKKLPSGQPAQSGTHIPQSPLQLGLRRTQLPQSSANAKGSRYQMLYRIGLVKETANFSECVGVTDLWIKKKRRT